MPRDPLVLCYHAISADWRHGLAVTPQRLHRQVSTLLRAGYRPATFADAMVRPAAGRTFAVTFDDAYRSVRERALPVLEPLGVPASVFVPTRYVEEGRATWEGVRGLARGRHASELDVMSWDDLAVLRDAGWEIGSHSRSHPLLTRLTGKRLAAELTDSRREIEQHLGVECRTVAYPYGAVDAVVVGAALAAGYRAGAGLPQRMHAPARMAWPRVGVYHRDGDLRFALKRSPLVQRLRTRGDVPIAPPTAQPRGGSPRISVIVPCHDDGPLVAEAVASVSEPEPIELVVVDDASTDPATLATLDELRSQGVRIVRHEVNRGLTAARRTGMEATSAPYVFPLDADDLAVPWSLSAMADRLDEQPEAAACFGDYAEFGTRRRVWRVPPVLDPYRVAFRNDYPVSSLYRRSVLESLGGWQRIGAGYEDWDLWMSLAERGHAGVHAGPGVIGGRRRLHGRRMLAEAAREHRSLYEELRRRHPRLFADLREHRRRSDLSPPMRALYPILFGRRPPLGLRTRLDEWLARTGR